MRFKRTALPSAEPEIGSRARRYLIQVKMGGGSLPSAGAMAQQAAGAVQYDPAALQQQQQAQAAAMQQYATQQQQ